MTTADWAFVISLFSLAIAMFGFIWNVWSKFIFPKPRLAVNIQYSYAVYPGSHIDKNGTVQLNAVNHGPSEIVLSSAIGQMRRKPIWRKPYGAILASYDDWPNNKTQHTSGGYGLPKRLEVGETLSLFLVNAKDDYTGVSKFGFCDSYGRNHWANPKAVNRLKRSMLEEKL